MKLEDDLKEIRYIRERVDFFVNESGDVILPAWQFALLVKEYESYRHSTFAWLALFLLAVLVLVFFPMILR